MYTQLHSVHMLHCYTVKSQVIHLPHGIHCRGSGDICVLLGLIYDPENEGRICSTKWWFGHRIHMIYLWTAKDFDLVI